MRIDRRSFLQAAAAATALLPDTLELNAQSVAGDVFLFGASVYPELQTRSETARMLDAFAAAGMNVVRVTESSWGNLETAPGVYNFGWLRTFLDDLRARRMRAILGTSTYNPPQWLTALHPEILVQLRPGARVHPMGRKAACLNAPLYREACRRYIAAIGRAFREHPLVIGWQLDNEIDLVLNQICYCPNCENAWRQWLRDTYHTPDELNRRLDLVSWGMKVTSLEEIPQPADTSEDFEENVPAWSEQGRRHLPAWSLAQLRFRRDTIMNFLAEQAQILRAIPSTARPQWITTDWNTGFISPADDPLVTKSLDFSGLNSYPSVADNYEFWQSLAFYEDSYRSAHGRGQYMQTEARFGTVDASWQSDPAPVHEQFRMWGLQQAAFGANGILYWAGNRWRAGNWPNWGGLLDWSGQPEPDFPWVGELGRFFQRWGGYLLAHPVDAKAVVLTDFDQRSALSVYPPTPSCRALLPQAIDALQRLGIGVDAMNLTRARDARSLAAYPLIVIASAPALDDDAVIAALRNAVTAGSLLLISPLTAYQNQDGVFRSDGFAANLRPLTGVLVRTIRRMGNTSDPVRTDEFVTWRGESTPSPVGMDGFCEILEVDPGSERLARFTTDEPILKGRAAAVQRRLGSGTVVKLGFWPKDDSLLRLLARLAPPMTATFAQPLPPGVQSVPRNDQSLFVINTTSKPQPIALKKAAQDRISGRSIAAQFTLGAYEVIWIL